MKRTAKKKGGEVSRQRRTARPLKERAEAVINAARFDIDTRYAVQLALKNWAFYHERGGDGHFAPSDLPRERTRTEQELRAAVTHAEAGEPVATSGEAPEYDAAARALLAIRFAPGMPDFVTNAVYKLLDIAAARTGAQLWVTVHDGDGGGNYSVNRLARFFASNQMLRLEIEERHDLAAHISAVLNDPATPAAIYNGLMEAVGEAMDEINSRPVICNSAEFVRLVLAQTARVQQQPTE